MSREFLEEVPEHLRSVWASEPNPRAEVVRLRVLKETEDLKNRLRSTSQLYKHIFKEDHFQHVTSNGELNLKIKVINFRDYCHNIGMFKQLLQTMHEGLTKAGSNTVDVPYKNSDTGEMDIAKLTFDSEFVTKQLQMDINDIDKGMEDFANEIVNANHILGDHDAYAYVNHPGREIMAGVNKMISQMAYTVPRQQEALYFKYAVGAATRPNELQTSIRSINWRFELRA